MSGKTALALLGAVAHIKQGATLSGASLDAELIRLCAQFDELTRESDIAFNAAYEVSEDAIAGDEPFRSKQRELLKRIIPLRAQTQAGFEARAHMMMLWFGTFESEILEEYTNPEDHGHWHHIMLAMFIRDAIGHDLVPVSRAHDAVFAGGVA
jgi:hypothetical protein